MFNKLDPKQLECTSSRQFTYGPRVKIPRLKKQGRSQIKCDMNLTLPKKARARMILHRQENLPTCVRVLEER